jgi:hypothetical protein
MFIDRSWPHYRPLMLRGRSVAAGAVAAPRPPRGAVDDRLFLPRLDRLAVCDLDAVLATEELRPRSEEVVVLYAAMLFCAMIAEFLGGVVTDYLLRRTRNLQIARSRMILSPQNPRNVG